MSRRSDQVSGIIRRIVAYHTLEIPPDIAKVVNVTRVTVTPDLRYADVFLTSLAGVENAVIYMNKRRSEIRADLGGELKALHTIPFVRLHVDRQSEELRRLDEILKRLL